MDLDDVFNVLNDIVNEISRIILGKRELIELVITALFSEGHVLIEGPPGTAKTYLAKSVARAIGGKYRRLQGNPDVLPSDITGFHVYTVQGKSQFIEGPIFANIVLVDELNRITPRSQSALLEAMQENQVTVDGITYSLHKPFLIIATQMPIPFGMGIYPIIETLADRFSLSATSMYNPLEIEYKMIDKSDEIDPDRIEPLIELKDVLNIIQIIRRDIYVDDKVKKYIASLTHYTRNNRYVIYGPSPRASIHLYRAARVYAALNKRDYVIPDDIKKLFIPAVAHRTKISPEAEAEGYDIRKILEETLKNVAVPKE